tara:strand:- start:35 stop:814 length:780 start_codon:yes stop_codon:yes gene_type:complete
MAQTLLTHEKMIENLIGEYSPSEHPELFRAGFHFVADLIPSDSELWQSMNLKGERVPNDGFKVRGGSGDGTSGSQKSLKIISVWRKSEGISYQCKEVSWSKFREGLNSDSLYYHGNSFKNPIYSISDGGRLFISPTSTDAPGGYFTEEVPDNVYAYFRYWAYEPNDFFGTSDPPSSDSFDSYHVSGDLHGFPRDAQLAAVIKSAMNILQVKMGEAVHEDEDPELLQLQQAQSQQLERWFESEMNRLNIPWRPVGIAEDK